MSSGSVAAATAAKPSRTKESIRTWLRLLSCETVIEQRLRSHFRSNFAVTLPQFDVLSELERADSPLTMSKLSDELMVSNGNITGVVDRLEKSKLVKRVRASHDRRIQYIELTGKGRKDFDRMANRHAGWLDELFADLSLDEMNQLQKVLLKLRISVTDRES